MVNRRRVSASQRNETMPPATSATTDIDDLDLKQLLKILPIYSSVLQYNQGHLEQ